MTPVATAVLCKMNIKAPAFNRKRPWYVKDLGIQDTALFDVLQLRCNFCSGNFNFSFSVAALKTLQSRITHITPKPTSPNPNPQTLNP